MDDIRELEDIAEIMEKEYTVSGRKELLDYAAKLRIGALVFKIVFVEPKMKKLEEWPLSPLHPPAAQHETWKGKIRFAG
jgi:hypothetical protein